MNARTAPKYPLRAMRLASLLAALLAMGCSHEKPLQTPTTVVVPSRLDVAVVNLPAVYDAVAQFAADAGLAPDPAQSSKETRTLVSRRVLCAPNDDERHTAWCIFSFSVKPAPDNPLLTSVLVRVRAPERADYDPKTALRQLAIESTLDRLVSALRGRFGTAAVAQTDALTF